MAEPIENLRQIRIEKLEKLRQSGVNPYPSKFGGRIEIGTASKKKLGSDVKVAGRIVGWRGHGKLIFVDLKDESGQLQLCFKQDELPAKKFKLLELFDLGDFLGVGGELFKTRAGELTVLVSEFQLLTKALRPLPSTWHGLKDVEERYRKRYLDLILNPEVKERFERISKIVSAMREYLVNDGYLEVLTPSLQPLYGGTLARPFETFFNALDTKMYLRISNEMYLKRLIAGGFEKVFEFSVDFRNEGLDRFHNPEFLQMETMWAYADYRDNMKLAEKMFAYIAEKVLGTTKFSYQGQEVDLAPPWRRVSMVEAVKEYGKIDFSKVQSRADAVKIAQKLKVAVSEDMGVGRILEEVFDLVAEKHLVQPTFVHDYHIETSPLAKPVPSNPDFTERFEIFIIGREFGNSYSEANDPLLLRRNFEAQQEMRKRGDLEAHPVDEDFLEAMEYGMPPTSGIGVGMERLFMLLTDAESIREVMFFPALRPRKKGTTEKRSVVRGGLLDCFHVLEHDNGMISREEALQFVNEQIDNKNIVKHMLATEACMAALAHHLKIENCELEIDEGAWALAGLLHDADYRDDVPAEKQGVAVTEMLRERGYEIPEDMARAMAAHNSETGVAPESLMDWAIFCCDSLTGLIVATALVRPDKKLASVEVKSVMKKYKIPSFASGTRREDIALCEEKLGIPLEEFVGICLTAMQGIANTLGL